MTEAATATMDAAKAAVTVRRNGAGVRIPEILGAVLNGGKSGLFGLAANAPGLATLATLLKFKVAASLLTSVVEFAKSTVGHSVTDMAAHVAFPLAIILGSIASLSCIVAAIKGEPTRHNLSVSLSVFFLAWTVAVLAAPYLTPVFALIPGFTSAVAPFLVAAMPLFKAITCALAGAVIGAVGGRFGGKGFLWFRDKRKARREAAHAHSPEAGVPAIAPAGAVALQAGAPQPVLPDCALFAMKPKWQTAMHGVG